MREIKFRGISKETGKKVFGYYLKSGDDSQIFDGEFFHSVEPESVKQFLSLDVNGEEIYDGDTLITNYKSDDKSRLVFFNKDGEKALDIVNDAPVTEITAKFFTQGWNFLALKK